MEATAVYIFIVGLISIVPEGNDVWLLVRDAQTPQAYDQTHCIEPHLPLLDWDAQCSGNCSSAHDRTFYRCDPTKTPETIAAGNGLWALGQEEISLTQTSGGVTKKLAYLATMGKIHKDKDTPPHKDAKKLKPDKWTKKNKVAPYEGLVARIKLTGGTIEDCHLAADPANDRAYKLDFGTGKHKDKMATDVALVTYVLEGKQSVTVESRVLGKEDGAPWRTMTLEPFECPKDPNGNKYCLQLVLSNQPPDDVGHGRTGYHFDRLYDFSEAAEKSVRWIPKWKSTSGGAATVNTCKSASSDSRFGQLWAQLLKGGVPHLLLKNGRSPVRIRSLNNRPICPMGGH